MSRTLIACEPPDKYLILVRDDEFDGRFREDDKAIFVDTALKVRRKPWPLHQYLKFGYFEDCGHNETMVAKFMEFKEE